MITLALEITKQINNNEYTLILRDNTGQFEDVFNTIKAALLDTGIHTKMYVEKTTKRYV